MPCFAAYGWSVQMWAVVLWALTYQGISYLVLVFGRVCEWQQEE